MPKMTCPSCGKQAITFAAWGAGINAFRTRCMNCDARLKGNRVVVYGSVLTLIVLAATIVLVLSLMPPGADDRAYRFLAVVPPALIGGAVIYCLGGYDRCDE